MRDPEPQTQFRVTAEELVGEHTSGRPAMLVGADRRMLMVGGQAVASVGPDPSRVTPLCATSAQDMPVVEVLSAIAASQPTGILILERPQRAAAFAFNVERGRVTSAMGCTQGSLPLPDLANADPDAGRRLVDEHVLEHLQLAREPGAKMTFIRGDVRWEGASLPPELGSSLVHLLLEHARRWDEEPKLLGTLGDLDQIIALISDPGSRPQAPTDRKEPPVDDDDSWDFFDDPDPAAEQEWQDALVLYAWCQAGQSLRRIVETSPLGRFRCLAALGSLLRGKHIALEPPATEPIDPSAAVIDLSSERQPRSRQAARPEAALPRRSEGATEYVFVRGSHKKRETTTIPRKHSTGTVARIVDPTKASARASTGRRAGSSTRASDRMQQMAQALQQRAAAEQAREAAAREAADQRAERPKGRESESEDKPARKKRWLFF